jgi:plastocyanin
MVEGDMIRKLWLLAIVVTVSLVAESAGAQGGRIVKGTVTVPPDSGSVKDVVISIDAAIGTPTATKVSIDQKNMTFVPHVLPVAAGSTVEFRNSDDVLHNVFSASTTQPFDVGMFGRGESRSVTFDKPGVIELRCNVHPSMHGFIVVLPNNYFTTPDERGLYQISGLPKGRFKLRAWRPSGPQMETWANLDDATLRAINLDFTP